MLEGNLNSILNETLDTAVAVAGADFGSIQLLDRSSSELVIVAQRGLPSWWVDFWNRVAKGRGACGAALERRQRVIVEDIERSPIFAGSEALDIQWRAGVRAVQSTPLISQSGALLGMFSTHYRAPHHPDPRALRLLDLLARHAADAIERELAEDDLIAMRGKLATAEESERLHIARELHEYLAQMLVVMRLRLEQLSRHRHRDVRETADEVLEMIGEADEWTRSLATRISPPVLYELGLSSALESLAGEMGRTFGLAVSVVDQGLDPPLSQEVRFVMYQSARELLINAAKHSQAGAATVRISRGDDELTVTVADEGVGFDNSALTAKSRLGLLHLRERISSLGGALRVHSTPGHGTQASLTVPLAARSQAIRQNTGHGVSGP